MAGSQWEGLAAAVSWWHGGGGGGSGGDVLVLAESIDASFNIF